MKRLLNSSKFWTAIIDVVLSVVLYFAGKYAGPSLFEDMKFVIITIQPVFALVIAAFCAEDVAAKAGAAQHKLG